MSDHAILRNRTKLPLVFHLGGKGKHQVTVTTERSAKGPWGQRALGRHLPEAITLAPAGQHGDESRPLTADELRGPEIAKLIRDKKLEKRAAPAAPAAKETEQ